MKPNGLPRSSAPSQPALIAALVLACSIFAGGCDTKEPETPAATQPVPEAAARPQAPEEEELTIAPEEVLKPWLGDLDGMIERGFIRLLTAYSKTFYFVDKATQRGLIYDFARVWEEDLNERLVTEGRLKGKHLKVKVVVIPVARDELLPALVAGRGDLVAANLTITEEQSWSILPRRSGGTSARSWCPVRLHPRCRAWTSWQGKLPSFASPPATMRA